MILLTLGKQVANPMINCHLKVLLNLTVVSQIFVLATKYTILIMHLIKEMQ